MEREVVEVEVKEDKTGILLIFIVLSYVLCASNDLEALFNTFD